MSYLVDGESRSLTFNICFEDGKSNEETTCTRAIWCEKHDPS